MDYFSFYLFCFYLFNWLQLAYSLSNCYTDGQGCVIMLNTEAFRNNFWCYTENDLTYQECHGLARKYVGELSYNCFNGQYIDGSDLNDCGNLNRPLIRKGNFDFHITDDGVDCAQKYCKENNLTVWYK